MKRLVFLFAIVILLLGSNIAQTEILIWHRSGSYDNNTPVPPEKIPLIKYTIYWGESSFGPWNPIAQVSDNSLILSASALPVYGGTMYYTGEAILEGNISDKGTPLKYVRPISTTPGTPGCATKFY